MKQDERAHFDRALHRVRLSAYPLGEFVSQEGFMRASEILALAVEGPRQASMASGQRSLFRCCLPRRYSYRSDGQGLNIPVLGSSGKLNFGILADRELVPDVERITAGLADELAILHKMQVAD